MINRWNLKNYPTHLNESFFLGDVLRLIQNGTKIAGCPHVHNYDATCRLHEANHGVGLGLK